MIDAEDTLHVCYRGSLVEERPRSLIYQRRPKGGEWSGPVLLVDPEGPPAYTQFANALHLAADERTLFLAYHIVRAEEEDHAQTLGRGFGVMRSRDGGRSWETVEGELLALPTGPGSACVLEFDEGLDVRVGNLACDSHGNPYFTLNRREGEVPQTFLYRRRKERWEAVALLPEVERLCGPCEMSDVCSLSISDGGMLYAAAVVCRRGGEWADPTNEIVLLTSRDFGDTFSGYKVSPEDPTVSSWLPSLERQTGHNKVDVPHLIYTHGEKGVGCSPEVDTEIRLVSLAEVARGEGRAVEEAIAGFESLSGLRFTGAHREEMGSGAGILRARYRHLRDVAVGYDVEPPTVFLPGTSAPTGGARTAFALSPSGPVSRPGSEEELAFLPVPALARLVERKEVSPVELTRLYLDRLSRYGPRLHCVVTLTEDLALKQAEAAEAEIVKGDCRGPLHGIPWGAKDLLATRGIRTTWGATLFKEQVVDTDATVVERLREAGAVLVAKLSLGSLAMGPHWFEGMTRNPWDVEGPSGGSSAGPGSATAAGLVGFSIGSETHGSIVSPSRTCGVAGLRPTYGRISRYGAMGLAWTMDKMGPMCRGVEDCAAVLAAVYGPDGRDRAVADVPFTWAPEAGLEGLRIGVVETEFDAEDAASRAVYEEALEVIRSLGGAPEPVALPSYRTDAIAIILSVEAATVFDDLTRSGEIDVITERDNSTWPDTFRAARTVPAVEYLRAQRVRTLLMRDMEALMDEWDLILVPGAGRPSLTVTNLTGHPAVILPCGFVEGLPVALTFIGRLYDEATPLAAARAYEQATEWHRMHPDLTGIEG